MATHRSLPLSNSPLSRAGSRSVRASLFLLETALRHRLDGPPRVADQAAEELSFLADNLCGILGVRPYIRGQLPSGPCVIVANHISYLDALIIPTLIRCAPLAKRELASWPGVGNIAGQAGAIFVARHSPQDGALALRRAMRVLASGTSVLVFPEGTTTRGDTVLGFQRGMFGIAKRTGLPIVPIAFSYEREETAWVDDQSLVPHLVRLAAQPLTRVSLRILAPLTARPHDTAAELASEARRRILTAHRELQRQTRVLTAPALAAHALDAVGAY